MMEETTMPLATATPPTRHPAGGGVSFAGSAGATAPSLSAIAPPRRRAPPHSPPLGSTLDSTANAAKIVIHPPSSRPAGEDERMMAELAAAFADRSANVAACEVESPSPLSPAR